MSHHNGPHEGNWSVFAEKVVEERDDALDKLAAAEARIGRLAELARREHYTCEDSWYSCPKSPEGCARDGDTDCTCGADYINAEVAKLCDAHNDLTPPQAEGGSDAQVP